jgi:hypothetical protein
LIPYGGLVRQVIREVREAGATIFLMTRLDDRRWLCDRGVSCRRAIAALDSITGRAMHESLLLNWRTTLPTGIISAPTTNAAATANVTRVPIGFGLPAAWSSWHLTIPRLSGIERDAYSFEAS